MTGMSARTRRMAGRGLAFILAGLLLASADAALKQAFTPYKPDLPAGSSCVVPIKLLHPTQIALGFREVALRADRIAAMKPQKLEKYMRERIAPVVIGPQGRPYLLDHHHLAKALLVAGASTELYAVIRENWATLDDTEFWKRMQAKQWVYLLDEKGQGPIAPATLPVSVADMRDDPYRSLAWAVRERNGYRDTGALFADLLWANFLRTRVKTPPEGDTFEKAIQEALGLVHAAAAAALPGYTAD